VGRDYFELLKKRAGEIISEDYHVEPPSIHCRSPSILGKEEYLATLAVRDTSEKGKVLLSHFDVCESYREKGIGTLLMLSTLEYLKEIGIEKVGLLVKEDNIDAQRLYKRIGFKINAKKEENLEMIMDLSQKVA